MKHIKLYEGFETNEYYTKIDTYNDLLSDTIDITDKDISIITKDLKYEYIHTYQTNGSVHAHKVLVIFPESGSLTINKLDDEWFIVMITSIKNARCSVDFTKYKCDQIEGLLKLLKDINYLK